MDKNKALFLIFIFACAFSLSAQSFKGGVKGTVVNRSGRVPIAEATLSLKQNGERIADALSDSKGEFYINNLADGAYELSVSAPDFIDVNVNFTVQGGYVKNLFTISLTPEQNIAALDNDNQAELDTEDTGYSDAPTILYSNDVFSNIAGFGFSSIRFKNRGYSSESQEVYLSGVKMNDAITGYSPYSLWGGLNEAMRSKESTLGVEAPEYGVGGYNGATNILGTASEVRKGFRASVLTNSALYRLRLMASYASGALDNGWSYAANISVRLGGNDWVRGVYYRSFAYYFGADKKLFGDRATLSFFTFSAPGERGAQNASTQEVYDLMGDNMYNSNWGYQNGRVRNSRVRKTFEPVTVLKYSDQLSDAFSLGATLLWRTGKNGYTALDWYDATDPRPDYYRNLPSYYFMEDEDYNKKNEEKAEWARFMWTAGSSELAPGLADNYRHVNWDRLYNVNYNNPDGRSKYALEERHVDQNDFQFASDLKWTPNDNYTFTGGANLRYNKTENYKLINDLLGGKYFLNIDQFAERDFSSSEAKLQNDLDYWLANGSAEKVREGGKYGYDYFAHILGGDVWLNGKYEKGPLMLNAALSLGLQSFRREGMMRKGLFAGLKEDGQPFRGPDNQIIPAVYDSKGRLVTSYGKSARAVFRTGKLKGSASYNIGNGHRVFGNLGYFRDAPTFSRTFISPRTRNSIIDGITTSKTLSADLNYAYDLNGYNLRLTGFYTTIRDLTDMMSVYDDSQQSFTNFAITGIDRRHAGIELGVKVPLIIEGLTAAGVLSYGEYIYTSTPHLVQTIDNSASIVRDEDVTYWKETPIFKTVTKDGITVYDQDADGNYIKTGAQKHYVPSTPQLATEIALNYRTRSYWFFEVNGQYFDKSYLDMNPLYRTQYATAGPDGFASPAEISYMTSQEKFDPVFLMNASLGKSWSVRRKYYLGFSLNVNNFLNNRSVRTGGFEQSRLLSTYGKNSYKKFETKYFYVPGANYMLNLYFRF